MRITRKTSRPVAGVSSYSPDNLPLYRGGGGGMMVIDPDTIFGISDVGDFWDIRSINGKLFKDLSGTMLITTPGDLLYRANGNRTTGANIHLEKAGTAIPAWNGSGFIDGAGPGGQMWTAIAGVPSFGGSYASGITVFASTTGTTSDPKEVVQVTNNSLSPAGTGLSHNGTYRTKNTVQAPTSPVNSGAIKTVLITSADGITFDRYIDGALLDSTASAGADTIWNLLSCGAGDTSNSVLHTALGVDKGVDATTALGLDGWART